MTKSQAPPALKGIDGRPLVRFATRVPAVKRTGNVSHDTQANIQRDALMRIIDCCSKDPRYTVYLHSLMLSYDPDASVSNPGDKAFKWTGEYKTLSAIPRPWMAEFLLMRAQMYEVPLTATKLQQLEEEHVENIPKVFSM
eukprot:11213567-Lingulodinium_polyedra.AAC.1